MLCLDSLLESIKEFFERRLFTICAMPATEKPRNRFLKGLLEFFENPDSPWCDEILMPSVEVERNKTKMFCLDLLKTGESQYF